MVGPPRVPVYLKGKEKQNTPPKTNTTPHPHHSSVLAAVPLLRPHPFMYQIQVETLGPPSSPSTLAHTLSPLSFPAAPPSRGGIVIVCPTLVLRRKDRTALVALSSSKSKATRGALGWETPPPQRGVRSIEAPRPADTPSAPATGWAKMGVEEKRESAPEEAMEEEEWAPLLRQRRSRCHGLRAACSGILNTRLRTHFMDTCRHICKMGTRAQRGVSPLSLLARPRRHTPASSNILISSNGLFPATYEQQLRNQPLWPPNCLSNQDEHKHLHPSETSFMVKKQTGARVDKQRDRKELLSCPNLPCNSRCRNESWYFAS